MESKRRIDDSCVHIVSLFSVEVIDDLRVIDVTVTNSGCLSSLLIHKLLCDGH